MTQVAYLLLGAIGLPVFTNFEGGTAWFCYQQQVGVGPALVACVMPFVPVDAIKAGFCAVAVPLLRARLVKARALA